MRALCAVQKTKRVWPGKKNVPIYIHTYIHILWHTHIKKKSVPMQWFSAASHFFNNNMAVRPQTPCVHLHAMASPPSSWQSHIIPRVEQGRPCMPTTVPGYPKGYAAPGCVQCQCNMRGPLSKLKKLPPLRKNNCDKQVSSWRHISCHTDKNRYYT